MPLTDRFRQVSEAPTRPPVATAERPFDVADLYRGPVGDGGPQAATAVRLDEKLRQAYYWITNHAIISPYYDIEYNDGPAQSFVFGDEKIRVDLPTDQSYSSYVLLPLLNLAVRRRCLLVGGPGRGKTVIAILMGVLSGYPLREIKRGIQHGQPQMTIADLLGNPLPSSLVNAREMDEVKIAWRKWLGMRIKIIDEYNRIPTRTQSALLTVMADNYAEIYDQIFECPEAAWYLTANDEAGGGTYQVIEALRELVVRYYRELALPYLVRFPARIVRETADPLPEGLDVWDVGSPIGNVDWVESVARNPYVIPGVTTLERIYGTTEGGTPERRPVDLYLGVDCSGSMANPAWNLSYPVLAGAVMVLSALRAGARAMVCLSGEEPGKFSQTDGFIRDETELLTILTGYLGTGYAFGIKRLKRTFLDADPPKRPAHILVVTDSDIFGMLNATKQGWRIAEEAARVAGGGATFILQMSPAYNAPEVQRMRKCGWDVHCVVNLEDLIKFAREFSEAAYGVERAELGPR